MESQLKTRIVLALLDLIRLRNTRPAFGGAFHLGDSDDRSIVLVWRKHPDWARLDVILFPEVRNSLFGFRRRDVIGGAGPAVYPAANKHLSVFRLAARDG